MLIDGTISKENEDDRNENEAILKCHHCGWVHADLTADEETVIVALVACASTRRV